MLNCRLLWFLFCLQGFVFSNLVVFSIQDSSYYESDMYSFYGMGEWNRASLEQKNKMVDDFLVREGAFLLGKKDLLHFSPSFVEKKHNKERQLLVNYVYQIDVSSLGKDSLRYLDGLKFLKEDLLLHHILVGFEGSALRVPVLRSKEDAYFLASSILDTLSFSTLPSAASQFSDDGSANRNFGRLGWVSWGSTVPSFESSVFGGAVGDFVGPTETEFGFHLTYIEDSRPSSFSFLSKEEYEDAVLLRSSTRDPKELRVLSSYYDSLVLDRGELVFNDSLISQIYTSFKGLSKERVNKNDIISVLKTIKAPGVVCVFNGDGLGLGWFIDRLSFFDPSNRPNIQDLSSLYSIFKTLLLQESSYSKGRSLGYFNRSGFKKQLLAFEKDLLYTLYFKNLVNSVPFPDSLAVKSYYLKNRDEKYKTQKALKLAEIKVSRKALADSVLNLYIEGEPFSVLLEQFSLDYSLKTKGLVGPVEKSFKGGALSSFFKPSLGPGYVDNVVENKDGTFSIYKIQKVYPSSYIPLEKTFNRISSIIHRELQETAKKEAISLFYKELNIVKNDSLF